MPPKRRGSKAAPSKPAKAARVSVDDRCESDGARVLARRGQTLAEAKSLVHHAKPLAKSTMTRNKRLRKRLVIFYAKWEKVTKEEAEETLFALDSPLPNRGFIEFWIESVATCGISKVGEAGRKEGWTERTTLNAWSAICSERAESCNIPFDDNYRSQINRFIKKLSEDGLLSTAARKKPTLRHQDFIDMMGAMISGSDRIPSAILRIQMCLLMGLLYQTGSGQRPGAVVESRDHEGSDECLHWGDTKLFLTGVGPDGKTVNFHWLITFEWIKGQRHVKSFNIQLALHSLSRENTPSDPVLYFIFLADRLGVFQENVTETYLKSDPSTHPKRLPHLIPMNNAFLSLPIFTRPTSDAPMTYADAVKYLHRGVEVLGHERSYFYMFRHTLATRTARNMPIWKVQYILGHKSTSNYASSTYQSRHIREDVGGMMVNDVRSADLDDLFASTAYNQHIGDGLSSYELDRFTRVLSLVSEKAVAYGNIILSRKRIMLDRLGPNAEKTHLEHPDVQAYQDALSDGMVLLDEALDTQQHDYMLIKATAQSAIAPHIIDAFLPIFKSFRDQAISISSGELEERNALDAIASQAVEHPYAGITNDDVPNPALALLERLQLEVASSDMREAGYCPTCVMRGVDTPAHASNNVSEHAYTCSAEAYKDTHVRCSLCQAWLTLGDEADLDNHYATCFENFCHKLKADRGEDDDDDDDDSYPGLGPFSILIRSNSRSKFRMYLCPCCLFDESLEWSVRLHPFKGGCRPIIDHFRTHFYNYKKPTYKCDTKIDYHKLHRCLIPQCDGSVEYNTAAWVEHLQQVHNIELIECSLDHSHSRACLALPENYCFKKQAEFFAGHAVLGRPMPTTYLIDTRRSSIVKNWEKQVTDYLDELEGKGITSAPASETHMPTDKSTRAYMNTDCGPPSPPRKKAARKPGYKFPGKKATTEGLVTHKKYRDRSKKDATKRVRSRANPSAASVRLAASAVAGPSRSSAVAGPSRSSAVAGPSSAVAGPSSAVAGPSSAVAGPSSAVAGPSSAVAGPSSAVAGPSSAVTGVTSAVGHFLPFDSFPTAFRRPI
ncbi:hypothetical protein D9611_001647 [Ephemerocybe angulata]|uniref:Uncharacterized protein n=1 Tax=Ephemerocybe angulata TaxID=980116 RepID=A0A8H5FMD7_9AGAR|nr:hypothetical protein D9611_001647 [Tulosesus angulatus]